MISRYLDPIGYNLMSGALIIRIGVLGVPYYN